MTLAQMGGVVVAIALAAVALFRKPAAKVADSALQQCAADTLALAGRLREAGCPEGVAAAQALLNVILEHPHHGQPEVRT